MLKQIKKNIREVGVWFFRLIGSEIRDCRTGRRLGRGLIFYWGGQVHLLGCDCAVVPVPIPQQRLTYWKQSIGFTAHPAVDFPRLRPKSDVSKDNVLLVVLDHRDPESVEKALALWSKAGFLADALLLAYGGSQDSLSKILHANKFHITGSAHKTSDHQRERQSYREVFSHTTAWLKERDFTHILFHEYDHLPMVSDLSNRLLSSLREQEADVLCYHLGRVDASTHPHWLATVTDTYQQPVALSMLGTGHFWTREAWEAVSADVSSADWYMELDLPTTAHRLGYRVREIPTQGDFVQNLPTNRPDADTALKAGAWTLHPVKDSKTFAAVQRHLNL